MFSMKNGVQAPTVKYKYEKIWVYKEMKGP